MIATHPAIVILGYSEAAMLLRGAEGKRVCAVISIYGEREFGVEVDAGVEKLALQFDDVETPEPGDHVAAYHARQRAREAAEVGRPVGRGPTVEDARAIVEFAGAIRDIKGIVLCHCSGGISRSPAAALLCLATWSGAGLEKEVVRYLRELRPAAMPHGDLVRFGDVVLARSGALVKALCAL